ncbi:hypothetical protein H9K76_13905 [Diaphorobacter ruginosibacter]|uniref:Uncharacterized protein n=1 Tax=Diaphorobacter ruginosibacter TaxID=1715720 RepID=A0A7G9RJE5_9BURK|nr:hypothetical protein [Diaphorobacter ruginosibacter]QNN55720.1 hypothetical protein H9K76_13905 [Diaphorobacter ruginosibacter]
MKIEHINHACTTLLPQQRRVGVGQVTQRAHFGVSPPKIRAEFCDHLEAFESIREIAAELGVGLGFREKLLIPTNIAGLQRLAIHT